jgi:hypothetical protein
VVNQGGLRSYRICLTVKLDRLYRPGFLEFDPAGLSREPTNQLNQDNGRRIIHLIVRPKNRCQEPHYATGGLPKLGYQIVDFDSRLQTT